MEGVRSRSSKNFIYNIYIDILFNFPKLVVYDNVKLIPCYMQHSIDCGGGTGIYLVVTSTYIVVIRGQRFCLWGSLYLDDFEEEDRDLK